MTSTAEHPAPGTASAPRRTVVPPGYAGHKHDQLLRLRKIEGQVRGVGRMVEQDRYCLDVLTQISAINRALQEVAARLLDDHVRHCVLDAAAGDPGLRDLRLDELTTALHRTVRP